MSGIMHNILSASTTAVASSYWASVLSGSGTELLNGIQFSGSGGDTVVVGETDSSGAGVADAYIAAYTSAGALSWQKTLGGASADSFKKAAVASSGSIYACGQTASQGAGSTDGLLVKYDASGNLQWQRVLGSATAQSFNGVGLDASENVFVCGKSTTTDSILAKYNSVGTLQWQRVLTYPSGVVALEHLTVDPATGQSFACGSFVTGALTFPFFCSSDTSGSLVSQIYYTGDAGALPGISRDSSNNLYATGLATGTPTNYRLFVFKLDSVGAITWQRFIDIASPASAEIGFSTAVNASGDVFVFGSGESVTGLIIAKYNSAGTLQWQRTLNSSTTESAAEIIVDASDNLWLAGSTGTNTLAVKLPGDGSLTGTYGGLTYAVSTISTGNDSFTATAVSITSASGSFTAATSTLTAGTPTLTNTLTAIP